MMTPSSAVDEAMLTGEPMPVDKAPGDGLAAGCLRIDEPNARPAADAALLGDLAAFTVTRWLATPLPVFRSNFENELDRGRQQIHPKVVRRSNRARSRECPPCRCRTPRSSASA